MKAKAEPFKKSQSASHPSQLGYKQTNNTPTRFSPNKHSVNLSTQVSTIQDSFVSDSPRPSDKYQTQAQSQIQSGSLSCVPYQTVEVT